MVKRLFNPFNFLLLAVIGIHFTASPLSLKILGDLGLLGIIISFFVSKRVVGKTGLEHQLMLLVAVLALSMLTAHLWSLALPDFFSWTISVGLFYLLFSIVETKAELKLLESILWWGFIVFLIAGLYQYLESSFSLNIPYFRIIADEARGLPRISSLFISRSGTNVFAAYLALFTPWWLYRWYFFFKGSKPSRKFLYIMLMALLLTNVVLLESRGFYVSFLAGTVFFVFDSRYFKQLLAVGLIVLCLAVGFIPSVKDTFYSLVEPNNSSNYDHQRTLGYAFRLIGAEPISGWGGNHLKAKLKKNNGRWLDVSRSYKNAAEQKDFYFGKFEDENALAQKDGVVIIHSPHNYYLSFCIEYGLLGLSALLYLLWTILLFARKLQFKTLDFGGYYYGLISFFVYCLFQDSLRAPIMAIFFWVYVLLVTKNSRLCKIH